MHIGHLVLKGYSKGCTTVLLLAPLLLLNWACGRDRSDDANTPEQPQVTFDVGYNATTRHRGSFTSVQPFTKVVYFANTGTYKEIKFFDSEATLIKRVSLAEALQYMATVARVDAWHLDSILLTEMYSGRVVYVNGEGEVQKVLDLLDPVNIDHQDQYELWPSALTSTRCQSGFILNLGWVNDRNDDAKALSPEGGTPAYYRYHCSKMRDKPLLARFTEIQDTVQVEFLLDSFYHRLSESLCLFDESAPYAIINGRVFTTSFYSDVMLVLDPYKDGVPDTLHLRSDLSTVHIDPPVLTEADILNIDNVREERIRAGAQVQGITWDPGTDGYIIILAHQIPLSDATSSGLRPFSVLRYDKDLRFVEEIAFNGGRYVMSQLLSLTDGLYMLRWKGKESTRGQMTFERILAYAN